MVAETYSLDDIMEYIKRKLEQADLGSHDSWWSVWRGDEGKKKLHKADSLLNECCPVVLLKMMGQCYECAWRGSAATVAQQVYLPKLSHHRNPSLLPLVRGP